MEKLILIISFILATLLSKAQTPIFYGGNGDGHGNHCYLQLPDPGSLIYNGGDHDGFAKNCFVQTSSSTLYNGGNGDGFANNCFEQDLTPVFGLFTGGDGDGFAHMCFSQEPAIGSQLFLGGAADGFAYNCFEQAPSLSSNLFYGGNGDGSAVYCYQQEESVGADIYLGGDGDGFAVDCYEQDLTELSGPFNGGDGDGATAYCYLQDDYLVELPIELVHFYARPIGKRRVELSWQTQSEINNDYFVVERSENGIDWEFVQEVLGAGNSSTLIDYSCVDDMPYDGISYYRLKQVDFDGEFSYSFVRSVDLNGSGELANELLIYPNPATQLINFQFDKFTSDEILLAVYTIEGQLIFTERIYLTDGQGVFTITDLSVLGAGNYLVSLSGYDAISLQQMFVVK